MGARPTRLMSDYQLRQLATSSGIPLWRLYEIYGAYRYYSLPFIGLGRRGYVKMYRTYNPMYAAYAPEMADRAFYAFDRDRNGRLNFYEFLTSVLLSQGQPGYAMQTAQLYAPTVRRGWISYPQAARYTNFLHRYYTPYSYTQPNIYSQQLWNRLHPYSSPYSYSSYMPIQSYYNLIRYNSIFTSYFQQPYQSWPKFQPSYSLPVSTPTIWSEEIYPLATQYQQIQPVAIDPCCYNVQEEVYPLPTQIQPMVTQPSCFEEIIPLPTQCQQIQTVALQPQPSVYKVHEEIYPLPYFQAQPSLWQNGCCMKQLRPMAISPPTRPIVSVTSTAQIFPTPLLPQTFDC